MKRLMLGNEAVARGLYEAGCSVVSSYPGTPSTEISEYAAKYEEIYAEWAPNEKVATEVAIGAAIGATVGAGTGAIIGKRMDKAADAAKQVENATVETITDANNLTAVKVTFDSGVLIATNKYDLNSNAKSNLAEFAKILKEYNDADVAIYGHTDSTGSDAINDPLSVNRANSVANYLKSLGVSANQIKSVEGKGSKEPVADNSTAAGRSQNRRVEVYMYASEAMINSANNGTLK